MGEPRPPLTDITTLIEYPETRHGRPCLAGTGISVKRIVNLHKMGMSPAQIHRDMDTPLPPVYAALTLYYANQEWFDELLRREQAEADRLYEEWLREQPVLHR